VIYALRAGVSIIPVALIGTHDLYLGKELTIRVGEPLHFAQTTRPKRQEVDVALEKLQNVMLALLATDYQEPTGLKLLRYFLNHILDISRKDLVTLNLHTNITEIKPLSASGRGLERGLN